MAAYIEAACNERVQEPAREAALKCIFDLLGAAAAGLDDAGPLAVRKAAPRVFGAGSTPIWFTGERGSLVGAAWANSSAAAALDLDDGNRFARGHPGAAIIPAAFAVARETGAALEDILAAIVIGYEIGIAVGSARATYGNSGTWTPYGVVAAAAALRRTPRHVIEHALAIAGESAPNQAFASGPLPRIPIPEGSAVKEGIPWSVATGLGSLFLAEAGHTGPRNILDSARHYRFPDDLALGSARHICSTYFKPYACCRHIHAPLAALEDLLDRHPIDVSAIDGIEVDIHSAGLRISNRPEPENLTDVQYSIPYCLALTALRGPRSLLPLTPEALGHDDAIALANKVKLSLSPEFDALFPATILTRVTVVCGGRRYVSDPTPPKGEPLMSWEALEEKFRMATRFAADGSRTDAILDAMRAARSGDIAPLMDCLAL